MPILVAIFIFRWPLEAWPIHTFLLHSQTDLEYSGYSGWTHFCSSLLVDRLAYQALHLTGTYKEPHVEAARTVIQALRSFGRVKSTSSYLTHENWFGDVVRWWANSDSFQSGKYLNTPPPGLRPITLLPQTIVAPSVGQAALEALGPGYRRGTRGRRATIKAERISTNDKRNQDFWMMMSTVNRWVF